MANLSESISQMNESVKGLSNLAGSGAIKVDPATGQAYMNAIVKAQDRLAQMQAELYNVKQESKLGSSPDSTPMANRNKEVAEGDDESAQAVIDKLREVLDDLKTGVEQSMKNYHETDAGAAGAFNKKM